MRLGALATLTVTTALIGVPLGGQTLSLTPAQVDCNRAQLQGLAERAGIELAPSALDKPYTLVLTFGSSDGGFAGLAYSEQFLRLFPLGDEGDGIEIELAETAEHHLWFSTNPDEVRLLRNPERPKLDSLSLTRNRLNSDLVSPDAGDAFSVTINPTLAEEPLPASLVLIDNFEGADGVPADAKPGRGLAGIVDSCHDRFTPADLHVFAVLAKTVRPLVLRALDESTGEVVDRRILIYRGAQGGELTDYRVDVYPVSKDGEELGRLALKVRLSMDASGQAFAGSLTLFRLCVEEVPDCTSVDEELAFVALVPPVFSGEFWVGGETDPVVWNLFLTEDAGDEELFFWSDLLAGTTWMKP